MNWYLEVLKKYALFDGRARRKEYWFFALFNLLIGFALMLVGGILVAVVGRADDPSSYAPLALVYGVYGLYSLAVLLPSIGVSIRRLHDTGRSGWWLFIALVPFVGGIVLLVFMLMDSQPGANQFGPNPKGVQALAPLPTAAPGY